MVPMDDDGENKSKAPNLMRLLKSRLQKLVDKTDDSYDFIHSLAGKIN